MFTVVPPGLLEHPILAEPLPVSGLTVEEIKAKLEADLKRRAVSENPNVLVGVREYLSHAIIVSGLVKDPGTKILRREAIPLYVVIADAQPAPEAGRVTVIRRDTGEALVIDLSKPAEMNLLVRPGDVITVQINPKMYLLCWWRSQRARAKNSIVQESLLPRQFSRREDSVANQKKLTSRAMAVMGFSL